MNAAPRPRPSPIEVDVWWADLTQADVSLAAHLPAAERERVTAVEKPADRGRRLVAAALLQHAVAQVRPGPVAVDRTCPGCGAQHGRPVVAGGPHLSVAHAGLLVVVATCTEAMVGVDVERTDRFGASADETLAWTRHEAAVKAGGSSGVFAELAAPLPGYAATLCVATGTDLTRAAAAGGLLSEALRQELAVRAAERARTDVLTSIEPTVAERHAAVDLAQVRQAASELSTALLVDTVRLSPADEEPVSSS